MSDRDEYLREHTLKGKIQLTQERVYAVLCGQKASDGTVLTRFEATPREAWLWMSRLSMATAVLVELLEDKGVMTAGEVDELLFAVAGQRFGSGSIDSLRPRAPSSDDTRQATGYPSPPLSANSTSDALGRAKRLSRLAS